MEREEVPDYVPEWVPVVHLEYQQGGKTGPIIFESDCQYRLKLGIDMFGDRFYGSRALHMHVVFNEDSPENFSAPNKVYDLKQLAWDFALALWHGNPNFATLRLRLGSNDRNPDALELSRYRTFQRHLADAVEHHFHDQLQELDAPIGFYNASGNQTFAYSCLKTIKIHDNDRFSHAPSGVGGTIGHALDKLRLVPAVTSLHITGSSEGCGFKVEDIEDVMRFHCKLREKGGGLTEIAFHGHHDFTLRELSKKLSGGEQGLEMYGLRHLTVPLPQYVSMETRQSHQETKHVVWRPDSMLHAATIIYAEHVLRGIRFPTPGPAMEPTLQSIHFSNEDAESTEVKIDKDEKGIVTFSVKDESSAKDGDPEVIPERHGPLSVPDLEWMCMDYAWAGLEGRMLDKEANAKWTHNLDKVRNPTVECPQQ